MKRLLVTLTLSLVISVYAFADVLPRHGYVEKPASRALLCSEKGGRGNTMCGSAQYEPQSIEGVKGFPNEGPSDGHIASGDNPQFDILNEQSLTRWKKAYLKSGENMFAWSLTTPQTAASWRYFITKQNWNPNKPLARTDFDLTPFCEGLYDGKTPSGIVSMKCNIPEREGYQVILGVWDIADTDSALYQVIDANINDKKHMDGDFIATIKIDHQQNESNDFIRHHLQVISDYEPFEKPTYVWFLPKEAKDIVNTDGDSSFSIEKEKDVKLEKARVRVTAGMEDKVLVVDINTPEMNHEDSYDYIYPDHVRNYAAGVRVYQPVNKKIYQCKVSRFCQNPTYYYQQYEPGIGANWKVAWDLIG